MSLKKTHFDTFFEISFENAHQNAVSKTFKISESYAPSLTNPFQSSRLQRSSGACAVRQVWTPYRKFLDPPLYIHYPFAVLIQELVIYILHNTTNYYQ
jgi:hypothetical protein